MGEWWKGGGRVVGGLWECGGKVDVSVDGRVVGGLWEEGGSVVGR